MTAQGIREFSAYLRECTDRQVQGVYDKEHAAGHRTYTICKRQAERLQKFLGADRYAELMGAA